MSIQHTSNLTFTILLANLAIGTAEATQQEITVALSGGDYTSVTDALNAIQPAADNRYVINVLPGTYYECEIPMKSYVHLRGAGSNVAALQCNAGYMDGTLMVVQQTDVEISGLRLQGAIAGVNAQSSSNVIIRDNYFETTSGSGFVGARITDVDSGSISNNQFVDNYVGVLLMASSPTVSNNRVLGKSKAWSVGISISQHAAYNPASPTVTGNIIEGSATGISFYGNGTPDSIPVISGNTIRDNSSHGMDIRYANDAGTVQGNTIVNNGGYGIHIHFAGPMILQNRITGNALSDFGLSGYGVPHISYNIYDTVAVISGGTTQGDYNLTSNGLPSP